MDISAKPVTVKEILPWRDLYRRQMNCQIVHDSLHPREGWTQPYLLEVGGAVAGYGSVLIGGPWTGTRTAFEFYVLPEQQSRVFDLFACFLESSSANAMKAQTNDALLTVMLHLWAHNITSEKIVFEDKLTTHHAPDGVTFRRHETPDSDWALELDGAVVATGGILFHYNRPYGDIYMEVAEPFRRRGLGSYLVQELKRVCYEIGSIPCARCSTENIASRKTLQKAGFVPCAHILTGTLRKPGENNPA
ncbi:MAG TPA: GNAT family N-acetyltransferase [Terracidiphilus sp.]|nr:GNAT family N-acetyltransferase [Terracidiphilus sp.]